MPGIVARFICDLIDLQTTSLGILFLLILSSITCARSSSLYLRRLLWLPNCSNVSLAPPCPIRHRDNEGAQDRSQLCERWFMPILQPRENECVEKRSASLRSRVCWLASIAGWITFRKARKHIIINQPCVPFSNVARTELC